MTLRVSFWGSLLTAFQVFFVFPIQARLSEVPPDPQVLLLAVRQQQIDQQGILNAKLREKSHLTPFQIICEKGTIRYKFSHPDQIVFLKLGEKSAEIWEQTGKASASVISRFDRQVRGTSVTYEDLAFRFLYWPNPTIVGEDRLNTRAAWILQVKSPEKSSPYEVVRIWVDKESSALLRMEGFDFQGHCLKRFEVISAQKIKNRWFLKEMRIEERDSVAGNVINRTYLTILPPEG